MVLKSVCLFLALLLGSGPAFSQGDSSAQSDSSTQSTTVVKVSVNVVTLDAQVLSRKTHQPLSGLKAEDFQIFDDGVKQQISSLSQDKLPLSVVFLFDLTDSVRPVLKSLGEGALQTLEHLKPEDEAAVMVYAASVQLLQDFTTDRELIAGAIRKASRMKSREAAFFNEGIFQAAMQAGKSAAQARRVIIWFTDNVPNIPSEEIRSRYGTSLPEGELHTQADAMAKLFKTGAVVFTLLQKSEISQSSEQGRFNDPRFMLDRRAYPPGDVFKYTHQTGGEVVESYSGKKISAKMAELIDQIRTRYALSYHPPANGGKGKFHEIRLEVSPDVVKREGKVVVETKRGYYR
jgi:VWFA-related protein